MMVVVVYEYEKDRTMLVGPFYSRALAVRWAATRGVAEPVLLDVTVPGQVKP